MSGDVPAEQRWCSNFRELQKRLKAEGTALVIEKVLGVGAVPVKVLADALDANQRHDASRPARQR